MLLQQSLATGRPLPPTMYIFERLAYHAQHHDAPTRPRSKPRGDDHDSATDGSDDLEHDEMEAREGGRALAIIGEPVTWDLCHVSRRATQGRMLYTN